MTTERQAQVRQLFDLIEDRAADDAMWVPVGHTHEDIDGVFVGAMALFRDLALGQQPERGAPESESDESESDEPPPYAGRRHALFLLARMKKWRAFDLWREYKGAEESEQESKDSPPDESEP